MRLSDLLKKNPTAAELRRALEAVSVDDAEAEVSRAEVDRRAALLDGSDKDLAAADERVVAANRNLERALATREELVKQVEAAEAREADAEYAKARAAAERNAKAIAKRITDTGAIIRDAAEQLAAELRAHEAEVLRLHDVRPDAPRIRDADSLARGSEELSEEVVSEKRVMLWAFTSTGERVTDQDTVVQHGNSGEGFVSNSWGSSRPVRRVPFIERTYRERRSHVSPWPSTRELLSRVTEAGAQIARRQPEPDERPVRTVYVPLEQAAAEAAE